MAKHTSGPWTAFETNGFQQRPVWEIYDSEGFTVCEVPNNKTAAKDHECDEIDANARLIASAPDMYEALKAAEQILKRSPNISTNDSGNFRGVTTASALAEVRAAIAKVEGRSL